jgi:hypothetical protein
MMHTYAFRHYISSQLLPYTHIVLTRTDYYYACALFLPSIIPHNNNTVVIPNVEWNSGVNDKWILCSPESFEKCFNLFAPFVANPKKFENETHMTTKRLKRCGVRIRSVSKCSTSLCNLSHA